MLLSLYNYNFAMNQRLISQIFNGNAPEKTIALFSHILNAQHIWNQRILKQKPIYGVFEVHELAQFETLNQSFHQTSVQIINSVNTHDIVTYTNTKNETFSNTVQDVLIHIVNHATYHRAQIAQWLRLNQLEPIPTDYISFTRTSI